jgi:hypothetical protein
MNNDSHKKQQSEKIQTMQEQAFLDKAADALDKSCDSMDGQTLSRLNRIRHAAIEHGQQSQGRTFLSPFGGLITACVLVFVVSVFYPGQPDVPVPVTPDSGMAIEDLDIFTSTESLEFFENLEFYQWLEENESSV